MNENQKENRRVFLKAINMSIDDMDKFEQNEMMKKRSLTKSTWYNWYN